MKKAISPETVQALNAVLTELVKQMKSLPPDFVPSTPLGRRLFEQQKAIATANGNQPSLHIVGVRVCDHCMDDSKEAFPYNVMDAQGKFWDDLCNDCFDELGCSYDN